MFYLLFIGDVFLSVAAGSKVLAAAQFDLQSWMKSACRGKQGHFGNINNTAMQLKRKYINTNPPDSEETCQ